MEKIKKNQFFTASRIAKIALFSALATVLYFFPKVPLPIFPSFLELNFSDLPALIGGFALGPISASLIVLVKIIIKLPMTSTAGVGELGDLIIGLCFVLPASIIYKRHKTFKGAVIGIIVGSLSSVLGGMIVNYLLLIPAYVKFFFGGNFEALVNMCKGVYPNITRQSFYSIYIFLAVLPFNLIRCFIVSAITLLVYKKISIILNKI